MASAVVGLTGDDLVQRILMSKGEAAILFGNNALLEEGALKKAYKLMALRTHPDKNPHPSAHEAFQLVQQAFETALRPLQSKPDPRESKPAPTSARPATAARTAKPPSSAGGPPPPPSWWKPPVPSPTTPTSSSHSANDSRAQHRRPTESGEHRSFRDDFAEVPLPPDIFNKFDGDTSHPLSPPPSVAKRAKPLPTFDVSGSDDDGVEAEKQGTSRVRSHFAGQRQTPGSHKPGANGGKQRSVPCSLKELFGMFDISDDDNDDLISIPISSPTAGASRHPSTTQPAQMRGKQSTFGRRQNAFTADTPSRGQKNVSCPFCSAGEFPAHVVSTVVCSSCSARFVPAGVREMSTSSKGVRSGAKAYRGDLCACGKASKGSCFLCE
ncbi:hypothetical protein, conserved [Trypanosoma brucei brucei TREU927]|uniref:J domain-containing protein n=1 Tax=Trypanosoma brucei brucei (strain 927/4 GUTat10.1) TaxID=185431 RepID=Q384C2_TRYB2|nr:hypothetical protein, conserved [Trypanosoma brucei brucei TREU927]EAN79859.1 hypothetical protein, conserved [Trypanosoma brucei brucei TREU927]